MGVRRDPTIQPACCHVATAHQPRQDEAAKAASAAEAAQSQPQPRTVAVTPTAARTAFDTFTSVEDDTPDFLMYPNNKPATPAAAATVEAPAPTPPQDADATAPASDGDGDDADANVEATDASGEGADVGNAGGGAGNEGGGPGAIDTKAEEEPGTQEGAPGDAGEESAKPVFVDVPAKRSSRAVSYCLRRVPRAVHDASLTQRATACHHRPTASTVAPRKREDPRGASLHPRQHAAASHRGGTRGSAARGRQGRCVVPADTGRASCSVAGEAPDSDNQGVQAQVHVGVTSCQGTCRARPSSGVSCRLTPRACTLVLGPTQQLWRVVTKIVRSVGHDALLNPAGGNVSAIMAWFSAPCARLVLTGTLLLPRAVRVCVYYPHRQKQGGTARPGHGRTRAGAGGGTEGGSGRRPGALLPGASLLRGVGGQPSTCTNARAPVAFLAPL